MAKVAILIDADKFNIFSKKLKKCNFKFTKKKVAHNLIALHVETNELPKLSDLVYFCNQEYEKSKMH